MNYKMFMFVFVAMLVMCTPAFANLESCAEPTYNSSSGWYNYIDGLNNSDINVGSYEVTSDTISPTNLAIMGATGMTKISGIHYMEADYDRGLAYLFYDNAHGKYYVVYQWSKADLSQNYVVAVPDLNIRVAADITYYWRGGTYNAPYEYYHFTGANFTRFETYTGLGTAYRTFYYYHFGASNITSTYRRCSDGTLYGTTTITAEGYTSTTSVSGDITSTCLYTGNTTGGTEIRVSSIYSTASSDTLYYPCAATTGKVIFNVMEGASGLCSIQNNLPNTTCTISYNASSYCNAAYTGSTVITTNATSPYFYSPDSHYFDATHAQVTPYEKIEYNPYGNIDVALFFDTTLNRSTTFYPWNDYQCQDGLDCAWNNYLGLNYRQLYNYGNAFHLRYTSPTGNINDLNSDILINTTFYTLSGCKGALTGGYQAWNITEIAGINYTTYKKTVHTCDGGLLGGTVVTSTSYGTDLNTLMAGTMMQQQVLTKKGISETWGTPMYIDYTTKTLNRFFYYEQFFPSNTGGIYEKDIGFKDNENFRMTYNYTQFNPQICEVGGLPYGTYWWSCPAPNASYVAIENSGYVTVAAPVVGQTALFQRIIPLNISINTLFDGISSPNIGCIGTSGFDYSAADGTGKFTCEWQVSPMSNENVSFNSNSKSVSTIFPIGDYYNSQQYGNDLAYQTFCDSFDGVYRYKYDINNPNMLIRIRTYNPNGVPINGVSIYWDGAIAGASDSTGLARFSKQTDFIAHNLTASKVGFLPYYESIYMTKLENDEYKITLSVDASSPFAGGTGTGNATINELFGIIASRIFVSMLLMLASLGAGTSQGGIEGGMIALVVVSAVLFYIGFLPAEILLPIGLVCAIIGGYTLFVMLGGNKGR